jgi:hypothetical protein
MHSPFKWRALSQDRRSAFFGAAVWGVVGAAVWALAAESWWQWFGALFFVLAVVLAASGAAASDAGLRRLLGITSLPWPL